MTWGIPTPIFLGLHVALSIIGIVAGLIAVFGMVKGRHLPAWAAIFLVTTLLTGVTGFPLPPFGLDPPRIVGIILLCLLAPAIAGLYLFGLKGIWRTVYVVTGTAALFLNVFVAIAQSFQKIGPLNALAPTQSEPPFAIAEGIALLIFIALGFLAQRRFRPDGAAGLSVA